MKMSKRSFKAALAAMLLGALSQGAQAAPVSWIDWVGNVSVFAIGTLSVGAQSVDVSLSSSSPLASATQTNGGTNYWSNPATYQSATVDNAPGNTDIIALNQAGTVTLGFSQSVRDPILALVNWNGNHLEFAPGIEIQYLGSGPGYWGSGSFVNTTDNAFDTSGSLHGAIRLVGDFNSITFTHDAGNWHGFTIGVLGLTPSSGSVPEPALLTLLGLGAMGLFAFRRRGIA
jgi:hypothetical protein